MASRWRPAVEAHVHQHVFSFRFDMGVDGERNAVSEVNFAAVPMGAEQSPWQCHQDHGEPAGERKRRPSATWISRSARYWRVINPNKLQCAWRPVGYKLVPGVQCACPSTDPDSPVGRRAGIHVQAFLGHAICKG